MGFEYSLVHVKYTFPLAALLTLLYRPLLTKLDVYKIASLVTIAVVSTTPWDSYLIRHRIWTYPSDVILGPKLFDIPAEELFFFIIQTYNTSLLYLLLSRPTFHPVYLRAERPLAHPRGPKNAQWRFFNLLGQLVFAYGIKSGIDMIRDGGRGTYMGLIIAWSGPFIMLLWSLAYQFIIGLPLSNTATPIVLSTLYLWIIDTLALKRGTWVIETGTKLGIHLWDGLEIEEAVFFLITNTLIVFGLIAFDNALAILQTFPKLFPDVPPYPSPLLLVRALLKAASEYDEERIRGLRDAVDRSRRKSRSFYLASSVFQGGLRRDLLLLYSFCRVSDDLVDDATSMTEAREWIAKLRQFLDMTYGRLGTAEPAKQFILLEFPPDAQLSLLQLPTQYLSPEPFYDLLRGFEMDLAFAKPSQGQKKLSHPISDEVDLELYARRVAGTVAELCLELVFYHFKLAMSKEEKNSILQAGIRMGLALQYVNIARDISVDAKMNRVYLPLVWLKEEGLTLESVLRDPNGPRIEKLRSRLLGKAFASYEESRGAIEKLPTEVRGPMRVVIESYMEIGRVLREEGHQVKAGKATVPKLRRMRVAWKALNR
ncbi:Lycopene beta-cyclase [Lepidopterella palustris CBS 459.81]|uniref:Bifunctional lycopene cyclase/phytoene synthase n=1 Tax=Lepidopterella palustris CBS 459.81 TaxID=1314670 RepID=A0A8E2E477_9PEZI|nr:Lycopene beta-cyclase [Lepidopterella palustris CBS 459.81]